MESSAGLRSLPPIAPPAHSGIAARGRRFLIWFFALPAELGVAISIVAAFSLTALAIAAAYGAPLSIPRERVSAALGVSAVLPVAIAIGLYTVLRIAKTNFGKRSASGPPLAQAIAIDLTMMVLFLVATYFHFSLKTWAPVINPDLYDELYYAIDRDLQPVLDLFYWIRSTWFSRVPGADAWYQAAFLLMFISGFCALAITRSPVYPRFCVAVLLTMCLGALSYLIAPALGPFIYEEGLSAKATEAQAGMLWAHKQVRLEGMSWIAEAGPSYFTGGLAAMPSLHMAHAVVMTYFICQARSVLIGLFLLTCGWVVIESVASRWHYFIDLPAGVLLAVAVIWLTNRLCVTSRRAGSE